MRVLSRPRVGPRSRPWWSVAVSACPGERGARAATPATGDHDSFPVRPLRQGAVWDAQSAGRLLSAMLRRARGVSLIRPKVLACAPTDASALELGSLREALSRAGASRVTVVPEPLAAAAAPALTGFAPAQILVDVGEG